MEQAKTESSMKTKPKYKSYLMRIEQAKFEQIKEHAKDKGMTIKSFILSYFIKP